MTLVRDPFGPLPPAPLPSPDEKTLRLENRELLARYLSWRSRMRLMRPALKLGLRILALLVCYRCYRYGFSVGRLQEWLLVPLVRLLVCWLFLTALGFAFFCLRELADGTAKADVLALIYAREADNFPDKDNLRLGAVAVATDEYPTHAFWRHDGQRRATIPA